MARFPKFAHAALLLFFHHWLVYFKTATVYDLIYDISHSAQCGFTDVGSKCRVNILNTIAHILNSYCRVLELVEAAILSVSEQFSFDNPGETVLRVSS